jgi:lysophospholipase L1-like esterase
MSCNVVKKIVVMGDSLSRGVVFDNTKNKYIISQENFCSTVSAHLNSVVYNVSKFGSTITRSMQKINQVLNKQPDAVLIEFGGNDCNFDWKAVSDSPFESHDPQTPVNDFESHLRELVHSFHEKKIKPIFMTLPPLDAQRFFDWVTRPEGVNPANVLLWLGCVERIYWWHEQYNSIILDVAESDDVDVINVRSAFLKQDDYRHYLCIDGMHPNEKGQQLIATHLEGYLKRHYEELLLPSVLM